MSPSVCSVLLRYGAAVVAVAMAIGARALLDPVLGDMYPFATLFFATLGAAYYGGRGPALLAMVLGGVAANYFLIEPRGAFSLVRLDHQIGMALYLAAGLGIALLGGEMKRARTQAEAGETALEARELEKIRHEAERGRARDGLRRAHEGLDELAYSLAHNLRAPLRAMNGFSQVLLGDYVDKLDESGVESLREVQAGAMTAAEIVDAILEVANLSRTELHPEPTDLSALARAIGRELAVREPTRLVDLVVGDGLSAEIDPRLARVLIHNLLHNAFKFTEKSAPPRIEVGATANGADSFFVRDNGAGFDMIYADKLFVPFQSLHAPGTYAGTRTGLATARLIVERHGGRIWGDGKVEAGATFSFSLPGLSGSTEHR